MNKKIPFPMAIVIIMVLGGAVAGAVLVYQSWWQTSYQPSSISTTEPMIAPDEIADWKTYRNEEYGFEMKYPSNFQIDEIGFTQRVRGLEEYPYQIAFGVGENPRDYILSIAPTQLSPSQWAEQSVLQNKIITPVTFNGIKGVKVSGKYKAGIMDGFSYNFYAVRDNKVYIFNYSYYDDQESIEKAPLYLKYFDQMISTFRFLEE